MKFEEGVGGNKSKTENEEGEEEEWKLQKRKREEAAGGTAVHSGTRYRQALLLPCWWLI